MILELKKTRLESYYLYSTGFFIVLFRLLYAASIDYPDSSIWSVQDAATYVLNIPQCVLPRTPVYPYIIKTIRLFSNDSVLGKNIVIFQSLISLASVYIFYLIVKSLFTKIWIPYVATLVYGIHPGLIFYNHVIRVESLSISFFVILCFFVLRYQNVKNIRYIPCINIMSAILVLLRPSCVWLFIIILILDIVWMKNQLPLGRVISLLSALLMSCLILGWCLLNYINYGEFSLTDISISNQLVMLLDTPMWTDNNDVEIVEKLRKGDSITDIMLRYPDSRVQKFVVSSYKNHLQDYIKMNVEKVIKVSSYSLSVHGNTSKSETFQLFKDNKAGGWARLLSSAVVPFNFFVDRKSVV